MKQKSSKPLDMDANITPEKAVTLSTNVKIETVKINPRPKMSNPKTLGDESLEDLFNESEDVPKDMGHRVYEVDGKKYRLRQVNPWAMWEVLGTGPVPKELQGRFTNLNELQKALNQWEARSTHRGVIARKHKEALGPSFDSRGDKED